MAKVKNTAEEKKKKTDIFFRGKNTIYSLIILDFKSSAIYNRIEKWHCCQKSILARRGRIWKLNAI